MCYFVFEQTDEEWFSQTKCLVNRAAFTTSQVLGGWKWCVRVTLGAPFTDEIFLISTRRGRSKIEMPWWNCANIHNGLFFSCPSNGNIFRVTGHLWRDSISHRWILLTKTSDAERWCILWSTPGQMVEQTIETPVFWDVIAPIMTSV